MTGLIVGAVEMGVVLLLGVLAFRIITLSRFREIPLLTARAHVFSRGVGAFTGDLTHEYLVEDGCVAAAGLQPAERVRHPQ